MMKHLLIRMSANLRNLFFYSKFYLTSIFSRLDKKAIIFDAYAGLSFNDNPKAIFEQLLESDFKMIWVFKSKELIAEFKDKYPQYHAIRYNSLAHYYYLNKCAFWVFNYKTPPYFRKSKETTFIQTWHGIPLKKLGCDIEDNHQTFYRSQQSYRQMAQSYVKEGQKCDYFITPSSYAKDKLVSAFKLNEGQVLEVGYPRNELLEKYDIQTVIHLKKKLGLTKKVILYAPTWRDDSASLLNGYKNNFLLDFQLFYENFHDEYQILYRPHYLINEVVNFDMYEDFIVDVSKYPDINELYIVSDLLITDYSSVYFDYSLLKRPIYFYMPDLEYYQTILRGFYISIDQDLPNDYYQNTQDLVTVIKSNKVNLLKQRNFYKYNQFYPLKYYKILNVLHKNS